jgi:putative ABC transport system permease protein
VNSGQILYVLKSLTHRKMRSWLTILSILIGVTAIFTLVSFGLGIQHYVDTLAEEAGADKLFIQAKGIGAPGTDENFRIKLEDIEFIEKVKGVKEISGLYSNAGEIKHGKQKKQAFVIGIDTDKIDFILESFTVDIHKGRLLKDNEIGKAVLGYNYQFENRIFNRPVRLGDIIEINNNEVEVVGFFEELGNPQDDSSVYLTFRGMESIFDVKDNFGWAMIRADKSVNPEQLAVKIEEKLRKFKGLDKGKEDFFVQTFSDVLATFGTIISIINGVLIMIALISLFVASINIMNTMFTSVLERTREIGVMKSIGAKRSDIVSIFIFESAFLGSIGGIIGVILGYIFAKIGGYVAANAGFPILRPVFPILLVIGCIFFAFLVGAIAGVLPALRASKLKPVDALRYE